MYPNSLEGKPKSDIVFYKAFLKDKQMVKTIALIRTGFFIVMAALIIFNQTSHNIFQTLLFNTIASLIGVLLFAPQLSFIYSNPEVYLKLAESQMHTVVNELTKKVGGIQDCVSKTIFFSQDNIKQYSLDQATKQIYISAVCKRITLQLRSEYNNLICLINLYSVLSAASIVTSIITLVHQSNLTTMTIIFLIIYIVLQGLAQLQLIFMIILIILIVPFLCIKVCCCKQNSGASDANGIGIPSSNAKMQNILRCKGKCQICRQAIGQNEEVYILPCSNEHIFHRNCMLQLSRVKNVCPTCKKEIPSGEDYNAILLSDM